MRKVMTSLRAPKTGHGGSVAAALVADVYRDGGLRADASTEVLNDCSVSTQFLEAIFEAFMLTSSGFQIRRQLQLALQCYALLAGNVFIPVELTDVGTLIN